ncbi:MAG: hypothetical protein KAG96_06230 [Ichthyobacteriaceae bacterium]|nr:hypothetical protein [Ichthyobacteriaceae bacterium]
MVSKFLLSGNPLEDESSEFILHTESPKLLAKVVEKQLGYGFEIIEFYDVEPNKEVLDNVKLEMLDFWNSYLNWEEEIAGEDEE